MIKYLNYILPEPDRYGADKPDYKINLTWETFQSFRNEARISKKFNDFLKGKSVVLVGPSPYLEGKKRGKFIDSHDVVIRMNKGWKIEPNMVEDFGSRTDIRWHCMMDHHHHGGDFDVEGMVDYGVKWLASQFPRNLDYFHNDNIKFETINNERVKFHCFADLIYFLNIHMAIETRPNVGPTAVAELINYDIDSLHLMGVSFFRDGWHKGYKEGYALERATSAGHAQEPQMHILKLILENEPKFTMDEEVKNIIYNTL